MFWDSSCQFQPTFSLALAVLLSQNVEVPISVYQLQSSRFEVHWCYRLKCHSYQQHSSSSTAYCHCWFVPQFVMSNIICNWHKTECFACQWTGSPAKHQHKQKEKYVITKLDTHSGTVSFIQVLTLVLKSDNSRVSYEPWLNADNFFFEKYHSSMIDGNWWEHCDKCLIELVLKHSLLCHKIVKSKMKLSRFSNWKFLIVKKCKKNIILGKVIFTS